MSKPRHYSHTVRTHRLPKTNEVWTEYLKLGTDMPDQLPSSTLLGLQEKA